MVKIETPIAASTPTSLLSILRNMEKTNIKYTINRIVVFRLLFLISASSKFNSCDNTLTILKIISKYINHSRIVR